VTLDEAVAALAAEGGALPREAMQWALDHWTEAGPRLLDRLTDYASGADRSGGAAEVAFYAPFMAAQTADCAFYRPLCRLLHDEEAAEAVFGDAITEALAGILVRVFDGDGEPLRSLVEDTAADPFVRNAALDALSYLAFEQRPETEMSGYLRRLMSGLSPDDDEVIWAGIADAVANLGYADLEPRVAELFRRGLIPREITDLNWFRKDLAETLADPSRSAGFERDHIRPVADAIGLLEGWHFSAAADEPDADGDWSVPDLLGRQEPYINPFRHVGRNDPCPCGSGKKFKRCYDWVGRNQGDPFDDTLRD
jgi:uncharacterized protein